MPARPVDATLDEYGERLLRSLAQSGGERGSIGHDADRCAGKSAPQSDDRPRRLHDHGPTSLLSKLPRRPRIGRVEHELIRDGNSRFRGERHEAGLVRCPFVRKSVGYRKRVRSCSGQTRGRRFVAPEKRDHGRVGHREHKIARRILDDGMYALSELFDVHQNVRYEDLSAGKPRSTG